MCLGVKLEKFGWYTGGYFTFIFLFLHAIKTIVLQRRALPAHFFSILVEKQTVEETHVSTEEHALKCCCFSAFLTGNTSSLLDLILSTWVEISSYYQIYVYN